MKTDKIQSSNDENSSLKMATAEKLFDGWKTHPRSYNFKLYLTQILDPPPRLKQIMVETKLHLKQIMKMGRREMNRISILCRVCHVFRAVSQRGMTLSFSSLSVPNNSLMTTRN